MDVEERGKKLASLLKVDPAIIMNMSSSELFVKVIKVMAYCREAADCDFLEQVLNSLEENNINVNIINEKFGSPLHLAARFDCDRLCNALLKLNANVDLTWRNGETPLHIAAARGCTTVARTLLKHGANVNAKKKFSETPLHVASSYKNSEIVLLLLNYGANVNSVEDDYGNTVLHTAIERKGSPEIIQLLIDHGADVNMRNTTWETPLQCTLNNLRPYVPKTFWGCKLMRVQVRNLVKMSHLKLHICHSNDRLLEDVERVVLQCNKEIYQMKKMIGFSNISFWYILVHNSRLVDGYVFNSDVIRAFNPTRFENKFPMYCDLILAKFFKSMRKKFIITQYETNTFRFDGLPKLPAICMANVLRYLTLQELKAFVDAVAEGLNDENDSFPSRSVTFPSWSLSMEGRKDKTIFSER